MEDFKKLICKCGNENMNLMYIFEKEFFVICTKCSMIHLGMKNPKIQWLKKSTSQDNSQYFGE